MHEPPRLAAHGRGRTAFRAAAWTFGVLPFVLLAGAGSGGCQSPTQVTIELRTFGALPCTSLKGVAIVVARTPAEAEARMKLGSYSAEVSRGDCSPDGHTIGTLVITPSEDTGALIVRARFNEGDDAPCTAPEYKGCIVARRSFSFIEHASVTLPVGLEAACVDVPCDVESSCRSGVCVSSFASCFDTGSCSSVAEPVPLPDGGSTPPPPGDVVIPEAGVPDAPLVDAAADAPLVDAAADSPVTDGSPDAPNNPSLGLCPTNAGAIDCFVTATPLCCADIVNGFVCTSTFSCPGLYPRYNCTSPLHCGAGACCGAISTSDAGADGGDAGAGGYVASCVGAGGQCALFGKDTICGSNADCPAGAPSCTKVSTTINGHTIYACQ